MFTLLLAYCIELFYLRHISQFWGVVFMAAAMLVYKLQLTKCTAESINSGCFTYCRNESTAVHNPRRSILTLLACFILNYQVSVFITAHTL